MPDVPVWTGIFSCGVLGFSVSIYNLVDGYRVPCLTIILLYNIKNFSSSYDTLQPAWHKILMKTKELWSRLGKTCAYVAALGSHGRSKFPVCVYFSVFPYGKCITRGLVAG